MTKETPKLGYPIIQEQMDIRILGFAPMLGRKKK
jgi:hypothetical protein